MTVPEPCHLLCACVCMRVNVMENCVLVQGLYNMTEPEPCHLLCVCVCMCVVCMCVNVLENCVLVQGVV